MHPLSFDPILKRLVWGGRRLGDRLGKPIGEHHDYAESWEIVDHGNDQSVVSGGPDAGRTWAGRTLGELVKDEADALMGRFAGMTSFPLLLKFLDCNRVLSVQVHPDDRYAAAMSPPDLGKTEAWYVLEAEPESVIYAGLKQGVGRSDLRDAVLRGDLGDVLHSFQPVAGDCVFIPAGTVHALGGGLLVAEIQQSSDTTFRLFDWNRSGSDGKPRPLHLDQALEVTDFERGPIQPQLPRTAEHGWATLVEADPFVLRVSGSRGPLQIGGDDAPHLLAIVRGQAKVAATMGFEKTFTSGQTLMLPACLGTTTIELMDPESVVLQMSIA